MITQAFKRWLHKIVGWLCGKAFDEADHAQAEAPGDPGMASEQLTRPALDGGTPPSGIAPLILGQGETNCSTLDERLDRMSQLPPLPIEKIELPTTPPAIPATPSIETGMTESLPPQPWQQDPSQAERRDVPAALPTPEQKLEFLHYLVERGIVNEGFVEGQVPRQYRQRGE